MTLMLRRCIWKVVGIVYNTKRRSTLNLWLRWNHHFVNVSFRKKSFADNRWDGVIGYIQRLNTKNFTSFFIFLSLFNFLYQTLVTNYHIYPSCVRRCGGEGRKNVCWRRKSGGIGKNEDGTRRSVSIWIGADDIPEAHQDLRPWCLLGCLDLHSCQECPLWWYVCMLALFSTKVLFDHWK